MLREITNLTGRTSGALTFEQEWYWLLEKQKPGHSALNESCIMRFRGAVQHKKLECCINELIRDHEALRAGFSSQEGALIRTLRPFTYEALRVYDISHLSAEERIRELKRQTELERTRSFDVAKELLVRAAVVKQSDEEHVVILTVHRLLMNGWTIHDLAEELSRLYVTLFGETNGITIPEKSVALGIEAEGGEEGAYWEQRLSGELPELRLPFDYPRPHQPTLNGQAHTFRISGPVFRDMRSLCMREGMTMESLLLTLLNVMLHRYTGQEDLIVGIVGSSGAKNQTLVIRSSLHGAMTALESLRTVRDMLTEATRHPYIPFAKLMSIVGSEGGGKVSNPLFQVMLKMERTPKAHLDIAGLRLEVTEHDNHPAFVDLTLRVKEEDGELLCAFVYNTDVFAEETIARMEGHFTNLLGGLLAAPDAPISTLPLLKEEERYELLEAWNGRGAAYPRQASIHELLDQQADWHPDRTALQWDAGQMTYRELDKRANQLAHYLQEQGLDKEQLVAICLERSPHMIVSFISVLKAGGAYVPLDMTYPPDRIAHMIDDSNVSIIITTDRMAKQLPPTKARMICLDKVVLAIAAHPEHRPIYRSGADSLAYVMYTSGSTGKPKGVAVAHRGIVRLVKQIDYADLGPEESILNLTTSAFDVSAFEIYGSLLNGGRLVLMNADRPSLEQIGETIRKNQVTTMCMTPEMLNLLIEDCKNAMGSLRQILSAGDALPVWLARKCLAQLPDCRLINAYGPTENSVYSTSYWVKEVADEATTIPIGRPIVNDGVYILDQHLQPVPKGVAGELYVFGDGVALGYLNNESLTAERFPVNPFSSKPGARMYKTGDVVRYRSDGNIEFIGRADQQVKIRGCRIELGEVEAAVGLYPGIRQIVAGTHKREDGTSELVVYVVTQKGERFNQQQMRSFVRERLPEFMVPSYFIPLEEIPVTPVGKIDRKRLPAPNVPYNQANVILPRNKIEEKLADIWGSLLDGRQISVTDNFFDLGGHSLLAMRMFSEIERVFHKQLSVSVILEENTIEKLAKCLALDPIETPMPPSLVTIQPLGSKPPVFCIHGGDGEVLSYRNLANLLGQERPVYGLRFTERDEATSIDVLAAKYIEEIKAVQSSGPYSLVGYSLGGIIAYEMARLLEQAGEKVNLLGVVDSLNPIVYPSKSTLRKRVSKNLKYLRQLPVAQMLSFMRLKFQNVVQRFQNMVRVEEVEQGELHLQNALMTYEPKPFRGKMLLLRANEKLVNDELFVDEKMGWGDVVNGDITVHEIPGNHFTLMSEPNVGHVAKYIKSYLIASERNYPLKLNR
ncbi:non-ribosomal peptide synthetase [Paenibacillus cremeus]|nr:non-ribosomal peptide synthetase [Paenibacillus cremeus]